MATRRALISVNGKVEQVALTETSANLDERLAAHVGLHQQKVWDWDAFPASRGYPELARAQMRYIGAGGSPKTGDTSTLAPSRLMMRAS